MKRALFALLLLAAPAQAALTERELATAVARPAAGARLPATLGFIDQRGARTTLGAAAAGRPLILVFADFTCRHVCAPGLVLTAGALRDSGLVAGRDYALAVVGIDPKDGPADARMLVHHAGLDGTATLLTGSAPSVIAATRALGYGYAYDAAADQFAHDAAVYVFATDGRLAALLPELALTPAALRAAVATRTAPPSFAERVAHLCYGFTAAHGRYGRPVVIAMQALAALTLLGFGLFFLRRRTA